MDKKVIKQNEGTILCPHFDQTKLVGLVFIF